MKSSLSKSLWSVKLLLLACTIYVSGFNSFLSPGRLSGGQVQQNNCCPGCLQLKCRCRPRAQFVNPNQYLCDPQWQNQCPPNAEGYVYPITDYPTTDGSTTPQSMNNQPGTQPFNPPAQGGNNSNALAFGQGGGSEGMGFGDAMIGDFFGGGGIVSGPSWNGVNITSPLSGGDRRYKLTEATSPIPTDRVFFNYNMFANALIDANGNEFGLNRYAFGLEKTFFHENISLELRIPVLDGVASRQTQVLGGPPNRGSEFGNVSLTSKFLLARGNGWTYSTGLGVIMPTASSAILVADQGISSVELENEAFYLQPFFAVHRDVGQRSWINFYTQCDFAAGGNTVSVFNSDGVLAQPSQIYNDQNLLFFDLSMGRWLYQSNRQNQRLRGVAGIFELHYTTTLNDTDEVASGLATDSFGNSDTLTNTFNRLDVFNTTLGLRFLIGPRTSLTVAGVAPLRINEEHLFDSEISVQLSHRR